MKSFIAFFAVVACAVAITVDHHEKHATIKSGGDARHHDGSYHYHFDTSNGISIQEHGNAHGVKGSASYYAPDGTPIHLAYVADEHGFQPHGDHLPTPPAAPHHIEHKHF